MTVSLLLLSSEPDARSLKGILESLPTNVRWCATASSAMETAVRSPPDLILIDSRSAPTSAVQLSRSFRSVSETYGLPLIVVAGQCSSDERIRILEAGADDCWSEPTTSREFLLRLHGFARRFDPTHQSRVLRFTDLELDLDRYIVRRDGQRIEVTPMQFRLLRHLLENPRVVFSREQLLDQVWNDPGIDEGAVTACVVRLRRALNSGGRANLIRSVPATGYSLDDEDSGHARDYAAHH